MKHQKGDTLVVPIVLFALMQTFLKNEMRKDVPVFVSSCSVCQQTKFVPKAPFGLLQPIHPPIKRAVTKTRSAGSALGSARVRDRSTPSVK